MDRRSFLAAAIAAVTPLAAAERPQCPWRVATGTDKRFLYFDRRLVFWVNFACSQENNLGMDQVEEMIRVAAPIYTHAFVQARYIQWRRKAADNDAFSAAVRWLADDLIIMVPRTFTAHELDRDPIGRLLLDVAGFKLTS